MSEFEEEDEEIVFLPGGKVRFIAAGCIFVDMESDPPGALYIFDKNDNIVPVLVLDSESAEAVGEA